MAHASLRDFIANCSICPPTTRVTTPVSPELEMTEIQTRLLAEGGPAVLFENVRAADGRAWDMPVLVNLFGTVKRV
ncbi:MAG: UbiD family decarboxylase, partial [Proteobacteria bacterium]|nr:UbiD family decarboxylase [Pseudomonadota bacterium]